MYAGMRSSGVWYAHFSADCPVETRARLTSVDPAAIQTLITFNPAQPHQSGSTIPSVITSPLGGPS